jgi:hypothetical protein
MQANTVLLKVEEFNELRDFKKEIKKGYTYVLKSKNSAIWNVFVATDEAIKDLAEINDSLFKEITQMKEHEYDNVKKMSIYQFLKLKYTRKPLITGKMFI